MSGDCSPLRQSPTSQSMTSLCLPAGRTGYKPGNWILRAQSGHIADAVCRNPSSIAGTGATFKARRVRVQCSCIESGYVVTKAPRISSKKEEAESGLQRRLKRMLFEIRVLTHEPLMFHDNIVQFLGISWEDDMDDPKTKWPSLVLEYADAGTLHEAINNDAIPKRRRLKLCLDVANGLSALHECGIIHSDVKPANILLFTDEKLGLIAKVADFGYSLVESGEGARLSGTVPWTAPEWSQWIPIDRLAKTDIYSFGLLVWAVMTNSKEPFQHIGLRDPREIDMLKETDTKMLQTVSYHLQECVSSGRTTETDCAPAWEVLQCTIQKRPELRDLARPIEVMNKAVAVRDRIADADGGTVVADSCRKVWSECTQGSGTAVSSEYILYLCHFLARRTGISHRDLVEQQRKSGGLIDEDFFERYCHLADQKEWSRRCTLHRSVDEIRVLLSSASSIPTMNVQDMLHDSLTKAAEAGSADAALYLAIFYTNVLFNPAKACEYMLRAAKLGSSSAMYLCYRFHKAHGVHLPVSEIQLTAWFHTGICWGSQVAYEDAKEADPDAIWGAIIVLQQQGSLYGDMPFQKAEALGPFDVFREDFATMIGKIRSLNQHIDDVIIAGENGDKLLHWATAMHETSFQRYKGLLKQLLAEGGADPNVRNAKGETPLLAAMRAGNGSAIWELLQHGVDASLASNSCQVPLHWLWTLPDYGSHSTEVNHQALNSLAASLSTGSYQNLLFKVVDAVADAVAARANDSWKADQVIRLRAHMFNELPAGTPLHWAAKRRSIPTVKGMLAVGASPSACAYGAQSTPGTGELQPLSAFHLAAAMHDDDVLELFIQAEPNLLSNLDLCPLAVAIDGNACNGYANRRIERMARHGPSYQLRAEKTFKWFWDHNYRKLGKGFDEPVTGMTWKPNTPLTLAAQAGQADVIEALLNTGFQRDLETKGGLGNHNPLQESIKRQCDGAYFLLRRHGASVSSHTDLGDGGVESNLALLATFGHNRLDIARDLIQAGVSVAAGQLLNNSPLLLALKHGSFQLARQLLDHGADPNELRRCVGRYHGLDDTSIDAPSTLFGCLLLQFGHHKLLPLKWILGEHRAERLTKPLQTTICPTTNFNVFHQLAFCPEVDREDDNLSLLNDVATVRESKTLKHFDLTPLLMAVKSSNAILVRAMLEVGADWSADVGSGLTVLHFAQQAVIEFEMYLTAGLLPQYLWPETLPTSLGCLREGRKL
ncbi:hypothetical protein B0T10DRAFT_554713 [Thelonectria olida]|uniref:Protein kinase domain-containing protein n=1 Tax=Thelonectria olida TaxID=1576542 RepID=A0A9P8WIY3_9HYPO|nr:hypothetical protein B0T10DRAFT_554713 [Thelonectria olida]